MKAECEKFGEVRKVIVFDVSIDSFSRTVFFFFYIQKRLFQIEIPNWYCKMKEKGTFTVIYHLSSNISPLPCLRNVSC